MVDPAAFRAGHARALLDAVDAAEGAVRRTTVSTGRDNEPALRLSRSAASGGSGSARSRPDSGSPSWSGRSGRRRTSGDGYTQAAVAPILERPGATAPIDLAEHPLEAGLVRLAVLGAEGFELRFDDPAVTAALAGCLAEGGDEPFDAERLRPYAIDGMAALEAAAEDDERLARLLALWRPRALALAGRSSELSKDEVLRARLAERLDALAAGIDAARAAGDDDRAQALHARYIELGTTTPRVSPGLVMARRRPAVADRVAATIAERALLPPGARVLALLSGGADSTLLVTLLAELGHAPRALHVAHGLRGADSDGDVDACRDLCARLEVELDVVDGRVEPGANLEARLRDVRRAAALARAGDGDPIATGHTATDRAETVLYRLATSGGVRALPALPHRAGRWVRPLLDLTRAEVRDELRRRGVPWRDDATNDDRGPARNRIRRDVLPVLASLNPAAETNVARAGALATDERELLDALAAELVEADGSVDLARLRAAHPALQRLALRDAAARAGVTLGHLDVEALRGMRLVGGSGAACRAPQPPSAGAPGCPSHPRHPGGRPRDRSRWPRLRDAAGRGHHPVRIVELAAEIPRDYAEREPLLVCVLKGAFIFLADLDAPLDLPVTSTSWPSPPTAPARGSSGVVRILKDLETPSRAASARGRGHRRHRPDAALPDAQPARKPPAVARGLRAARRSRRAAARSTSRSLRRLRDRGRVRRRLRAGLRRALPQPALHRRRRREPPGGVVRAAATILAGLGGGGRRPRHRAGVVRAPRTR